MVASLVLRFYNNSLLLVVFVFLPDTRVEALFIIFNLLESFLNII